MIGVKGELNGVAEVRDKHGNLKGSFTFGGPCTSAEAAMVSGIPEERILENLGKQLSGDSHGSDTDHRRP